MLIQFLVGGLVSVCNIAIHALVMTVVVRVARASIATTTHPSLLLMTTMIATVSVLMGAHVVEVFVWSLAYAMVGAVPAEGGLVYFAFVSYATLGYGDVLPVQRWQLLGPMAAMNGALLFGWSTAVIFEVLQRTMTIGFNTAAAKQDRISAIGVMRRDKKSLWAPGARTAPRASRLHARGPRCRYLPTAVGALRRSTCVHNFVKIQSERVPSSTTRGSRGRSTSGDRTGRPAGGRHRSRAVVRCRHSGTMRSIEPGIYRCETVLCASAGNGDSQN